MTEHLRSYENRSEPFDDLRSNILLVDDQSANLLVLRTILEELGQNLVEARSTDEALRRIRDESFAVVILDIQVPGLDVFETAKRIREDPRTRQTAIIFLTAFDDDRCSVEQAYTLGAVDFLVKPLVPIILKAKVFGFIDLFQKTERLRLMERRELEGRLVRENARLHESERFHRAIADLTTDYAFAGKITEKGDVSIESVTEGFERFYEMSLEEMNAAGGWGSVIHPDDFSVVRETIARLQSGESHTGVVRGIAKRGSSKWQSYLTRPIVDPKSEKVVGFYGAARDISAQREAAESQQLLTRQLREQADTLAAILAATVDHLYIIDNKGRYQHVSNGGARILGFEPAQMVGQDWRQLNLPPSIMETFDSQRNLTLTTGTPSRHESSFSMPDGSMKHFEYSIAPIRGTMGDFDAVVVVARDDTERKQAEESLREADHRKDEFLATLAHELRNPLAPIRNSLQILKMPRVDPETVRRSREMIERHVHHLVRLVDDLLDVSRVIRGKIELRKEHVELSYIVARAVETAQSLIDTHGLELVISLPKESVVLYADVVRLSQVFGNLLTNAAKYTEENGVIRLTAQLEDRHLIVMVSDTGIGIASDMLTRVFELFVQTPQATIRSQGGLGIGLTLVKNLVEMHGGSIEARSPGLGKGSEFLVRLPIVVGFDDGKGESLDDASALGTQPIQRRVLVVDDNRDAANSLAVMLQLVGYVVHVAYDGPAALAMALELRPDVIFLDLGMPGMDGYEVATRLRKQPHGHEFVLAAVSGWGQQNERRRSTESGIDYHLVKPVEPALVERLLRDLTLP